MHEFLNLFSLGHYKYCDYSSDRQYRGKGHNKQAHKNNYKQKRKGKRGK